jgi:phytoene synthase
VSTDALGQYLTQWREAQPQRGVAWLFLRPDEQLRYGALAALEREWVKALREVTEPQVATIKLGWWREELQRADAGAASHPLTQSLFADPRVRAVASALWAAAIDAAALAVDPAPAVDFAAQRAAALPYARAVAALETALWFEGDASVDRAAEVTMLAWLVAGLRALQAEVGHGRPPLPMNLLARHGLVVGGLATDGPARRAALRDYVDALAEATTAADALPGPLTLFRGAQFGADRATLRAARRSDDPLRGLLAPRHGVGDMVRTWRAARAWRAAARQGA